jgi:predicted dinucleotide-binding enzyme
MDPRPTTTETPIDTIGIIGAGHAGQAFARVALRAGRKVRIANSRAPGPWAPWWKRLARRVGRPTGEAAAGAMVVIAVPWASGPTAVAGPA